MGDKIHPTHFQVPEMPYKRKEQEAVVLLQRLILRLNHDPLRNVLNNCIDLLDENKDLVEWVMKYKGE